MCFTWFAHDCALATWACVWETFLAQWGDCGKKKSRSAPFRAIIIIVGSRRTLLLSRRGPAWLKVKRPPQTQEIRGSFTHWVIRVSGILLMLLRWLPLQMPGITGLSAVGLVGPESVHCDMALMQSCIYSFCFSVVAHKTTQAEVSLEYTLRVAEASSRQTTNTIMLLTSAVSAHVVKGR